MFNVGDIVRGKESYHYRITNEDSKCLVIDTDGGVMSVRVVEAEREGDIGREFLVEQSGFELIKSGGEIKVKEEVW